MAGLPLFLPKTTKRQAKRKAAAAITAGIVSDSEIDNDAAAPAKPKKGKAKGKGKGKGKGNSGKTGKAVDSKSQRHMRSAGDPLTRICCLSSRCAVDEIDAAADQFVPDDDETAAFLTAAKMAGGFMDTKTGQVLSDADAAPTAAASSSSSTVQSPVKPAASKDDKQKKEGDGEGKTTRGMRWSESDTDVLLEAVLAHTKQFGKPAKPSGTTKTVPASWGTIATEIKDKLSGPERDGTACCNRFYNIPTHLSVCAATASS